MTARNASISANASVSSVLLSKMVVRKITRSGNRHVAIPRLLGIGIDGFDEYWCIGSIGIDGIESIGGIGIGGIGIGGTESIGSIGIDSFGAIRY